MAFFSEERILRGVLTWRQAVALAALLCVVSALFLFMPIHSDFNFRTAIGVFVVIPLAIAALIDSVCHILPDPLLFFATVIALSSFIFSPWSEVVVAVISAAVFLAIGVVMSRMTSLGRGDAKLMGVMGLWLGNIQFVFLALVCAMVGAALFALVLLIAKRAQLTTSIALGPWLVAGSLPVHTLACISA